MTEEKTLYMEMMRRILRIRYFDEEAVELVQRGEIVGAVPLLYRRGGGSRRRVRRPAR